MEENLKKENVKSEDTEIESKTAQPSNERVEVLAETDEKSKPQTEMNQKEGPDPAIRKRKIWPIITAACLFVLLVSIYGGVALYYQTHFLPGTIINGIDCGGMEIASVVELLDAQITDYSLEVTGRDYATGASGGSLGIISPSDIQLSFMTAIEDVEQILNEQNQLLWVTALFPHEYGYNLVQGISYDYESLETAVRSWSACQNRNMVKAQDAYISEYSEELQGYEIISETMGTELDVDQVVQAVVAAVDMHESSVDLEEAGLYKTARVTRDDEHLTNTVDAANLWLSTEIIYDWNGTEVILDLETLKDWVTIVDGEAMLDEAAVLSFVKSQARQYDTYGKNKNIITALGVELTLRSPNYGWWTDTESETAELIALIKEGSSGAREPVYLSTGAQKGTNDIGDSYVEADLTHQHLYLYEDGELVLETDFVSGNMSADPGSQTPQGIFGLTYKTTNAVLRGQNYATPVSYWMPFYGNYGMHDATWRSVFGGDIYLTSGSHGCINLPLDMAEQIYQYVYAGSPVVCYYYPEPVNPEPAPATEQIPEEPEVPQYEEMF